MHYVVGAGAVCASGVVGAPCPPRTTAWRGGRSLATDWFGRVSELQNKIQGFISLGYKPSQFTYDSTQLQNTLEQIPYARLEVTQAIRAYDQFREDARREGILPGWLR